MQVGVFYLTRQRKHAFAGYHEAQMKFKRRQLLIALGSTAVPGAASATACPALAGSQGDINLVGSSLPAIQHLARAAEGCSRTGLKVSFKITPQARTEVERAFGSGGRSPFDAAVISAGVFSNLYSRRQLDRLTDLVDKFGSRYKLEERMLVRVNGEVMALAFMQNTQNLVYRQDLFDRHRIAVPTTYAQMLQAAATIRAAEPEVVFPIAQGFGKGFDVAVEFTNILASLGGQFFEPGSATPAFQGALGVEAVNIMRSVLPFMSPNALAMNTDDVMNQLQLARRLWACCGLAGPRAWTTLWPPRLWARWPLQRHPQPRPVGAPLPICGGMVWRCRETSVAVQRGARPFFTC